MSDTTERAVAGHAALAAGDWQAARALFEAVEDPDAGVLEGLGQALWWLGEPLASLRAREQAFRAYRRQGDPLEAARLAVWLSREYRDGRGNSAAANGWCRRAARLVQGMADSPAQGWLALLDAERSDDSAEAVAHADEALAVAERWDDLDGELRARAQRGLAQTRCGRVDAGLAELDEAMAAVTSETLDDWETFGYVCCALVSGCELAGDGARLEQWGAVVSEFLQRHAHVPLLAFCASCCGEMFLANGAWEAAESELQQALDVLEAAGQTTRCVHPAARLAHLRVLQGRLEDAARLLAGYEGLPEAVVPAAALHSARGAYVHAGVLLRRRIDQVGATSLLAAPLLALQVEVALTAGDLPTARQAAKQLAETARTSGLGRVDAEATLALGRVAAATGATEALDLLEQAVGRFVELGMPLHEARTRLDMARLLAADQPEVGGAEARSALATFERLGARQEADAASALLRELSPRGRTGPKGYGTLTRRETEVLRLLGHGLTNAEIAERLFISTKTAGNHVSSILSKLGVRNRAEAAVHAERTLPL